MAPSDEPEPFHQLLLQYRMELARLCGCAYFTVAPNEVIENLSVVKPTSFAALQELDCIKKESFFVIHFVLYWFFSKWLQ